MAAVRHRWGWCGTCRAHVVLCGRCGTNTCSGTYGPADGSPYGLGPPWCPACPSAYELALSGAGRPPALPPSTRVRGSGGLHGERAVQYRTPRTPFGAYSADPRGSPARLRKSPEVPDVAASEVAAPVPYRPRVELSPSRVAIDRAVQKLNGGRTPDEVARCCSGCAEALKYLGGPARGRRLAEELLRPAALRALQAWGG